MVVIFENIESYDEDEIKTAVQQTTDTPKQLESEPEDSNLTPFIRRFLQTFEANFNKKEDINEPKFKVSEVFGGVARLYEKIRTTVEYKGDHVLRRNAIERILKRLAWEKEGKVSEGGYSKISESLVRELIWARYLPNNSISKMKIKEVSDVLANYFYVLSNVKRTPNNISASDLRTWVWGVASAEIEEVLDPSEREAYVRLMFDWFKNYFDWQDITIDEHEKDIQLYIAVHRALPKSDDPILRYHLILKEVPDWDKHNRESADFLVSNFNRVYQEIEKHLNYKGKLALFREIQKQTAAFEIFKDISLQEKMNLRKLLTSEEELSLKIRRDCELRYKQSKSVVARGIIRSIIYIFITKIVFAFFLEIPYEVYRLGDVRLIPLTINIIFPPFLMFLVGMSIRTPGDKNTLAIINRLESVIYEDRKVKKQPFEKSAINTNPAFVRFFSYIYIGVSLIVFMLITSFLVTLKFTFVGIFVFFAFISLVLSFAYRIRFNAQELKIVGNNEGIVSHFVDYLTTPFINLGFYLSKGLSKINFATVLLDFLIEAPLKNIIEIFEEWTSYLRQKKEEIVEIPE